jgi:hypothetical protein
MALAQAQVDLAFAQARVTSARQAVQGFMMSETPPEQALGILLALLG